MHGVLACVFASGFLCAPAQPKRKNEKVEEIIRNAQTVPDRPAVTIRSPGVSCRSFCCPIFMPPFLRSDFCFRQLDLPSWFRHRVRDDFSPHLAW